MGISDYIIGESIEEYYKEILFHLEVFLVLL